MKLQGIRSSAFYVLKLVVFMYDITYIDRMTDIDNDGDEEMFS